MHTDELDVPGSLVRRLIMDQFPQWGDLPISRVQPEGTVHAIFRLGDSLSVRLARVDGATEPGDKEIDWLPRLVNQLPVEIPVPVAQGRPTAEYPWFWNVAKWVDGEMLAVEAIDATQAARDLARFVSALQRVDPTGAPRGRGVPLTRLDDSFRHWRARFDGDPAVSDAWERALAAAVWTGPPVWHHGDLDARNWLVRDQRITGVIDWGAMGVGDPACDLMVAWKLHSAEARDAFKDALAADPATWERARGWVIWQSVAALAYYTPENNPLLLKEAEYWLSLALA